MLTQRLVVHHVTSIKELLWLKSQNTVLHLNKLSSVSCRRIKDARTWLFQQFTHVWRPITPGFCRTLVSNQKSCRAISIVLPFHNVQPRHFIPCGISYLQSMKIMDNSFLYDWLISNIILLLMIKDVPIPINSRLRHFTFRDNL